MPLHSQDPVFTHYYANALQLNPSLAGIEGPSRIYIGYRNQWPNSGDAYVTYQASFDQYVEKLNGGIGVKVASDQQGDGVFNAYNLDVMYSYQFRATRRWSLSGGLQAGIGQRSFDPNSLVFSNMISPVTGDPIQPSIPENIVGYNEIYPDFAAGISGFFGNFYGGISLQHLFSPVVTDDSDPTGKISRKYVAHIGAIFPVIDKSNGREILELSPNFVFIQQKNIQQINYGLDVIMQDFLIGVYTRHDYNFNYGNLIFTAGYGSRSLRFRYSYDIKLSSPTIRIPNMGAHEISLLIIYDNRGIRNRAGAIKYPNF
jgi:type IX secretion system PorP/SprF family membrane protein